MNSQSGSLVSVIVPVYNVEKYLDKCVDSILTQSYQNLEIILVDDGSTDSSGKLCDKYSASDRRIKVIHKPNGGLSDARNAGLDIATGDFIAFVDSDDYISKSFIEIFIDVLGKNDCDIATLKAGTDFWDNGTEPKLCDIESDCSIEVINTAKIIERMLYQNIVNGAPFKVCKRYVFNELRFPVGYYYEDVATTYKEFLISLENDPNSKSVIIDGNLYAYRKRSDSIIRQKFNERKLTALKIFDQLVNDEKLVKLGLHNAACSRAYAMLYSVFLQIPNNRKELKRLVWSKLQSVQKTVMFDRSKIMRKKNKYAAWISLLGMNASYAIGKKFGQKGSRK